MAPKDSPNRADLIAKDAMYLFELMRDSPHPILLHIGPYAEKTGTKANTIVKRLSEIKKRNDLNIVTTTSSPDGGVRSSPATRQPATQAKRRVKREKLPTAPKTAAPTAVGKSEGAGVGQNVKLEKHIENPASDMMVHNLPSPADSASDPPQPTDTWTATNVNMDTGSVTPLKRSHAEANDHQGGHGGNGSVLKKLKTETWGFS